MFVKKIGIDLGTANVLVHLPKKGIVVDEPSVVAIHTEENRVMAVGNEAKEMIGRTPETIVANRPLRDGVIADYRVTEAMIRYFINKVAGGIRFFRPEVMISIPAGATSTERKAVIDATLSAGAKAAYIILEPVAAAIGAGIPIGSAMGNMVVDIGGGTSEIAIISLGGVVVSNSVRVGGNKLDQAIASYIRKKHGLAIGDQTAEKIKKEIGSALPLDKKEQMDIRGRDLIAGLPKTITITSDEITEAIQDELNEMVIAIKVVLEQTPPELAADIIDNGMVMTGGGALLRNLDKLFTKKTNVPAYVVDNALSCVAKGTGIALENLDSYKKSVLATGK